MKLIIGLGNPGEKYSLNRHNVGWMIVDALLEGYKDNLVKKSHTILSTLLEFEIKGQRVLLVKPLTYVNNSGESVSTLSRFYKVEANDICVVHDDLDLRLGEWKLQKGKGPKIHNGVNSIEEKIGDIDFWRLRIGVDGRDPDNRTPGDQYVLQNFKDEELKVIHDLFPAMNKIISQNFLLI